MGCNAILSERSHSSDEHATSANSSVLQTTLSLIPENSSLHRHRCENFNSTIQWLDSLRREYWLWKFTSVHGHSAYFYIF
jgi:hypothetical protein